MNPDQDLVFLSASRTATALPARRIPSRDDSPFNGVSPVIHEHGTEKLLHSVEISSPPAVIFASDSESVRPCPRISVQFLTEWLLQQNGNT